MKIQDLQDIFRKHSQAKAFASLLKKEQTDTIHLSGLQGSAAALLFSSLSTDVVDAPFLIVMDDEEEAGYFYHDLVQAVGENQTLFFPSSFRRAIKFGQRDTASEVLRVEVLSRIGSGEWPRFIVTYPQALAEKVVTKKALSAQTLTLREGELIDIGFIQETLSGWGFHRVDYVYEPGQFAVRGSIVDVYSFSCEYPYRIDFFGDEVDSIRTFEVQTQLSRTRMEVVSIVPELLEAQESRESFFSFMSERTMLVLKNVSFVSDIVRQAYQDGFCQQAVAVNDSENVEDLQSLDKESLLVMPEEFDEQLTAFRRIILSSASSTADAILSFKMHPQPIFHKNFDLLFQCFQDFISRGYRLFILADSEKQTLRLKQIFEDSQTDITFTAIERTIHAGFTDDNLKICCFTDHEIFDRYHKYNLRNERTRNGKVALTLKEIQQFEVGDYVVHSDHGIGRFGGLIRIPNGDKWQEVIKITYKNDDVVFVSIHSLHKVSKYKGKDNEPPRISTLGTGAWERMKDRAKTKIKDIARDLIKLYSQRREQKGFSFSPDSFLQHELEASFLYEDTPDQLKTTQDVKRDMEKSRPMDRLVCGDVGFGKTEIAVRAAFKACADNKQVVLLVPTTVLAYQHYRTFSERLKDFPVRVEYLSRARSAKKTKEILDDLKSGKINIIIGTHKLIGKSVSFLDLGLLIIDEEQKFGVSTKEKLRQLKVNVDTLTLTATPIPRTLQFSLIGARDLSVIQTPPPNRYPIQTQLCTFSAEVIAEAVNFEISRNGQVFIVSNRISSLPELQAMLSKYVPDARVAIGHGQMPPEELEQIMLGFANYDYDVLISTTIIESGLDISNANTIIITSAQNFGLSDLHQMRGRVGRSNRKAFCYLLTPPLSALPVEARRRLQAIENFSDLGSGIHIAMQDLDIRGAGNLLGAEQSGFVAELGYETYQKILSEAVKELRNDEFRELYTSKVQEGDIQDGAEFVDECQVESDVQMYFAEEYVPTSSERMLLYRELDSLERESDVEDFRSRMQDRFGPLPAEAEELIRVVSLRRLGKYFGTERMVLKNQRLRLYLVSLLSGKTFCVI